MNRREGKKRLSKNLLQMKFMKRTKEQQELDIENEERQEMFKNEISDAMRAQGLRFITEPSFAVAENLLFGRLAFNGANPEIEKMMENKRLRAEEVEEAKREKDVQDEEMAAHYGNLKGTVAKKFATKRSHSSSPAAAPLPDNPAEFLEKGAKMVGDMRKNSNKWGGRGEKPKKFMKPTE